MYYSAKHSLAIACHPSVGLSARLSVCNVGGSPAYYGGPIGTLLRMVGLPFPTTYTPLSLDWRAPKTAIAIISRTGKFTHFNFGRYIKSLHANETSLKILEKRVHGHIQGLLIFWVESTPYYLRNWWNGLSEQKSIKNVGKSSCGRRQGLLKIFRAAIYRAHHAVVFVIAQLSC